MEGERFVRYHTQICEKLVVVVSPGDLAHLSQSAAAAAVVHGDN